MTRWPAQAREPLVVVALLCRRSAAARMTLPLAVIGCWSVLYSAHAPWVGRPLDTSLVIHAYLVIVAGPVLAALTAWDHTRRSSTRDAVTSTAARSEAAEALARVAAALVWCLGVLASVTAAAFTRTWSAGGRVEPAWSLILLSVAVVALEVAVALAVAMLVRHPVAALISLATLYLTIFVQTLSPVEVGPSRLFPLIQESWDPWSVPAQGRLLLSTLWCAAAVGCLLTLTALAGRRSGPRGWPVLGLTGAGLIGVALMMLAPHPDGTLYARPRSPADTRCTAGPGGEVCVWAPDTYQLPLLHAGLATVRVAASGVLEVPERAVEQGIADDGDDVLPFMFARAPRSGDDVVAALLEVLVPEPAQTCSDVVSVPYLNGFPLHLAIGEVLGERAGLPAVRDASTTGPAVDVILAAPQAEQTRWLRDAVVAVRTCAVPPDLPSQGSGIG